MRTRRNLQGQRFGRLVAEKPAGDGVSWICQCDCGKTKAVRDCSLTRGATKSCGCLLREKSRERRTSHGMSKTREYRIWRNMISRCRYDTFANRMYRGKGIRVCERWIHSFSVFLADMGPCPSGRHSIDRFPDPEGDYTPENCRWATHKQQCQNRSNNMKVQHAGRTMPLVDWAKELGINYQTLHSRIKEHGWAVEDALEIPTTKAEIIEFRGKKLTIRQWSETTGIPDYVIRSRLHGSGWSIEDALTVPVGKFLGCKARKQRGGK